MPEKQKTIRKLRAILSADVKGYSRLMEKDETLTIQKLNEYRQTMSEIIQKHFGRIVDAVGDNLLAEFPSAVDAVQSAVNIQKDLKEKNKDLSKENRLEFRIGINVGDVVQEGKRLYGSGVNVAARIEALADPGGVCISQNVYDHTKNKFKLGYEYSGEHAVKNIKDPIRVYKILMAPEDAGKLVGKKQKPLLKILVWFPVIVAAMMLSANWFFQKPAEPEFETASIEKMAFPLPDIPSIAVLPFMNMSKDPEQEYFSDGLTEEIITALSNVPELFIIARNSTFTYKGKDVKIRQVAEEFGVRFVLKGSCRKSGNTVRITVQLVDAITGYHLWGERYEREMKDIFALQDEITIKILNALQIELGGGKQASAYLVEGTDNLEAYLKLLKGRSYSELMNKDANALARKLYKEAIVIDPAYAMAYLRLSATHIMDIHYGSSKSPKQSLDSALELVQKALTLNDDLAEAHSFLGRIYLTKRQYDDAINEGKVALSLAPNSDFANAALAFSLHFSGRSKEAIALYEKAIRLNPIPPDWYLLGLASSYLDSERYEEAITLNKKILDRSPENLWAHLGLVAIYSLLNREQDARVEAAKVLKIDPKFSLKLFKKSLLYKKQVDIERRMEALRRAGLT